MLPLVALCYVVPTLCEQLLQEKVIFASWQLTCRSMLLEQIALTRMSFTARHIMLLVCDLQVDDGCGDDN